MNKAILIGRLTADPELKSTASGISVCTFTLACDRRFKDASGERQADFIRCVAWRQTAEFVSRYFHKGLRVAVEGRIQTRSYENDNGRQFITEINVEAVEFADGARGEAQQGQPQRREPAPSRPQESPRSAAHPVQQQQLEDIPGLDFFDGDDETALPFDL